MFDVHGKLAIENNEEVIYVPCLLKLLLLKVRLISHLSSSQEVNTIELNARLVLGQGLSLADMLFSNVTKTKQIA
jgi:hypothetical protein